MDILLTKFKLMHDPKELSAHRIFVQCTHTPTFFLQVHSWKIQ